MQCTDWESVWRGAAGNRGIRFGFEAVVGFRPDAARGTGHRHVCRTLGVQFPGGSPLRAAP